MAGVLILSTVLNKLPRCTGTGAVLPHRQQVPLAHYISDFLHVQGSACCTWPSAPEASPWFAPVLCRFGCVHVNVSENSGTLSI